MTDELLRPFLDDVRFDKWSDCTHDCNLKIKSKTSLERNPVKFLHSLLVMKSATTICKVHGFIDH